KCPVSRGGADFHGNPGSGGSRRAGCSGFPEPSRCPGLYSNCRRNKEPHDIMRVQIGVFVLYSPQGNRKGFFKSKEIKIVIQKEPLYNFLPAYQFCIDVMSDQTKEQLSMNDLLRNSSLYREFQ